MKAGVAPRTSKFFDGNRLGTPVTFSRKFQPVPGELPAELSLPAGDIPGSFNEFPGLVPKVS